MKASIASPSLKCLETPSEQPEEMFEESHEIARNSAITVGIHTRVRMNMCKDP